VGEEKGGRYFREGQVSLMENIATRQIIPTIIVLFLVNSAFAGYGTKNKDHPDDWVASEGYSRYYLGARAGFIELENVDDEGSVNFGVLGGLFFSSGFSMETSLDFQQSDFYVGLDGIGISTQEIERETIAMQIGLTFTPFPDKLVRPFALGGLGYYFSEYSAPSSSYEDNRINDGGYYIGVGLDCLGGGWRNDLSIVGDVRWMFTQKEEFAEQEVKADGFMISIGFRWKR
jgi:hypothetical protein